LGRKEVTFNLPHTYNTHQSPPGDSLYQLVNSNAKVKYISIKQRFLNFQKPHEEALNQPATKWTTKRLRFLTDNIYNTIYTSLQEPLKESIAKLVAGVLRLKVERS